MLGNNNGCIVDGNGFVMTPSGAKVARVHDGLLWLYDKRTHEEVPFTLDDVAALFTETRTDEVHAQGPEVPQMARYQVQA